MIAATTVAGIDVSRDWLDGFGFPGLQRFRLANSAEGHEELISMVRQMPVPVPATADKWHFNEGMISIAGKK